MRIVNEKEMETSNVPFNGESLAELSALISKNEISYTAAGVVIEQMFESKLSPSEIVLLKGLGQISDKAFLEETARKVISENEKSVSDYKKGKTNALGYLVGQCMRKTGGKANPALVKAILEKILEVET